jgi:uncharacterized integral membrane protein
MSALNGTRSAPVDPVATAATTPTPQVPAGTPSVPATRRVPRTRTGATWVGICAASLTLVVLIIFMLQNTRKTEVTFLWMHGTVPLALALLIAGVGVTIVALVVGTARITQLRHGSRRPH